jgi:FHS family glucose/mannose:H+ symporter-like MFS transporter
VFTNFLRQSRGEPDNGRGTLQQIKPTVNPSRETAFRPLAPVFFYFVVAGIVTVMLGPLLPSLIQHWNIQDAQAGTLFTATFAGQLCGAWFGVRNLRASVIYGAFLTAIGCAAMAWADFVTAHFALFCVGTGLGSGLTAGNVIVGTAVPAARARLLAILNVAWSVGAITCPVLVRVCGPAGTRTFFYLTSAILAITAIFATVIPHTQQTLDSTSNTTAKKVTPPLEPANCRIPLQPVTMLIFVVGMLLYVGIENTLGGWLPSYAIRINPSAHSSTIALYFWLAQLVGRLLMSAPTTLLGEAILYRASLMLLVLTETLLLATPHIAPIGMVALTILSGLTLAPLYPLILSFLLARTGSHPQLGPLFASASLGGATLPWFTGIVSTQFHDLRAGLAVPAAGAILLLLLSAGITSKPSVNAET